MVEIRYKVIGGYSNLDGEIVFKCIRRFWITWSQQKFVHFGKITPGGCFAVSGVFEEWASGLQTSEYHCQLQREEQVLPHLRKLKGTRNQRLALERSLTFSLNLLGSEIIPEDRTILSISQSASSKRAYVIYTACRK